jgi:hypothetical protein
MPNHNPVFQKYRDVSKYMVSYLGVIQTNGFNSVSRRTFLKPL